MVDLHALRNSLLGCFFVKLLAECGARNLLATINFNNFILIDVFEDVRCVHQDANSAGSGDNEEDVELESIDNHCNVFPIFASLKRQSNI